MKLNRAVAAAAYLVVAGLILTPAVETALSVWPVRPGDVTWRYAAAGMLSRGLMTSLLGLVLAVGVSFLSGHRQVLRSLAVAGGLGSLVLLVIAGGLILDALQLRGAVGPEARIGFDLTAAGTLAKVLHGSLVTAFLAIGGWRWGSDPKATGAESAAATPTPLMLRTGGEAQPRTDPQMHPRGAAPLATRPSSFSSRWGPRSW